MLPPISDVTHITLAHCDAVGRGYPPHQFSMETPGHFCVEINNLSPSRPRRRWKIRIQSRKTSRHRQINSLQGHPKRHAV